MARNIDVGVGTSNDASAFVAGCSAAAQAFSAISDYSPSLTLVFASGTYDPDAVAQGVESVVGVCPMIGTSSTGEICSEPVERSVVVTILASPHIIAEVNVGENVTRSWTTAAQNALPKRVGASHFAERSKLGRPLYFSHPAAGLAPIMLLVFAPGFTGSKSTRSYEIHDFLKKRTLGRVPIIGGLSSTPDLDHDNYQIANGRAYRDSVVMAAIESNLLFGVGVAHGFRPSTKAAIVTRARKHVIYELDKRPAAEVCAELCGIGIEQLQREPIWFSRMPFGAADGFGGYHLLVPEHARPDGSVAFNRTVDYLQAVTLMRGHALERRGATRNAVDKAMAIGHLDDPAAILLFTGSLRYRVDAASYNIERQGTLAISGRAPTAGFLAFGEFGLTEEGLPFFCNQSVVALVIGNEVDEYAVETRLRADTLGSIESQLRRKSTELEAIQLARDVDLRRDNLEEAVLQFEPILARLTGAAAARVRTSFIPPLALPRERAKGTHDARGCSLLMASSGRTHGHIELVAAQELASLDTAAAIADYIAWKIDRVLLERTVDEQATELETVRDVEREILQTHDYNRVLSFICARAQQHAEALEYSLWTLSEGGESRCEISTGDSHMRDHQSLVREAIRAKSILHEDIGSKFILALPIVMESGIAGVLALTLRSGPPPEDEQLGFLLYLTTSLALALEMRHAQRQSAIAREMHHRVKNNLQIIASLLGLQLRRVSQSEARRPLQESIERIMSIAAVHEVLCGSIGPRVDVQTLLQMMAATLVRGLADSGRGIKVELAMPGSIELSSRDATNLAIIVNELIGNSLKHGFRDSAGNLITIEFTIDEADLAMSVADDGRGLPPGFSPTEHCGLGLQLVKTLAETEFHGRFSLEPGAKGTVARLTIPRRSLENAKLAEEPWSFSVARVDPPS